MNFVTEVDGTLEKVIGYRGWEGASEATGKSS